MTDDQHPSREVPCGVPAEDVIVRVFFDITGFGDDLERAGFALIPGADIARLPVIEHAGAFDSQAAFAPYRLGIVEGGTAC